MQRGLLRTDVTRLGAGDQAQVLADEAEPQQLLFHAFDIQTARIVRVVILDSFETSSLPSVKNLS